MTIPLTGTGRAGTSGPATRPLAVEPVEGATRKQWIDLAGHTLAANGQSRPSQVNGLLDAAALAEPQSPVAPAYRIWAADNLAREKRTRSRCGRSTWPSRWRRRHHA